MMKDNNEYKLYGSVRMAKKVNDYVEVFSLPKNVEYYQETVITPAKIVKRFVSSDGNVFLQTWILQKTEMEVRR